MLTEIFAVGRILEQKPQVTTMSIPVVQHIIMALLRTLLLIVVVRNFQSVNVTS